MPCQRKQLSVFSSRVGDADTIQVKSFTVVGSTVPSSVRTHKSLYMNLSDDQVLTNNTGYITTLTVFAETQ